MKKKLLGLGLICIAALTLVACGSGEDENSTGAKKVEKEITEETTKESVVEEEKEESFVIGDAADVNGEIFTLNSVEISEERNEFADTDPEYVVVVKWTVENNTEEDIFAGAGMDFYDSTKTKAETYPLESKQDNIAPGMKFEAEQAFGISSLGDFEIHLTPMMGFDGKKAVFKGTL